MFEQLDLFANQFDTAEEAVSHINEYAISSQELNLQELQRN